MPQSNLERMIQLANEFFRTKQDPTQISVNQRAMEKLRKIHPATMMERRTKKGPIAWTIVIPTTQGLMRQFVAKKMTENDLLKKTPLQAEYDAAYLCSALVLPEHRRKGLAQRLLCRSVEKMMKRHPIRSLFYWGFSKAGTRLAISVAKELRLPLCRRPA